MASVFVLECGSRSAKLYREDGKQPSERNKPKRSWGNNLNKKTFKTQVSKLLCQALKNGSFNLHVFFTGPFRDAEDLIDCKNWLKDAIKEAEIGAKKKAVDDLGHTIKLLTAVILTGMEECALLGEEDAVEIKNGVPADLIEHIIIDPGGQTVEFRSPHLTKSLPMGSRFLVRTSYPDLDATKPAGIRAAAVNPVRIKIRKDLRKNGVVPYSAANSDALGVGGTVRRLGHFERTNDGWRKRTKREVKRLGYVTHDADDLAVLRVTTFGTPANGTSSFYRRSEPMSSSRPRGDPEDRGWTSVYRRSGSPTLPVPSSRFGVPAHAAPPRSIHGQSSRSSLLPLGFELGGNTSTGPEVHLVRRLTSKGRVREHVVVFTYVELSQTTNALHQVETVQEKPLVLKLPPP